MAGQQNSKIKLLYIKEILERFSDEEHILNSSEILEKLEFYHDITGERKSLYSDIEVLDEYGMDIIKTRTPRNGFFVGSREFELAEIRLLCDAVQAANFISKKKTKSLIERIEKFTSVYQAERLKEQVYIDSRPKCTNENIFYTINDLDDAIKSAKKVKITYTRRKIAEKFATEKASREFVLSPYALIWSDDHYYLVANNEKYDNLMNLRIDRIDKVEMLDEKARPFSQVSAYKNRFDAADYAKKTFNMFTGEEQSVELICSNALLEEMLDRFGDNANIRKYDDNRFTLRAEAFINDGFVSWVMQFGDGIQVAAPDGLKQMITEKANKILALYGLEK